MDTPELQVSSPYIDPVMKCTIFNGSKVDAYNIVGDYDAALPQPWIPPVMLPPRAQSFEGRAEDISWLLERLTGESGLALAIYGPSGVGKTALVAEVLTRLVTEQKWSTYFPDGIFYHSFYRSPSLTFAFEELVRIFGGRFNGGSHRDARHIMSRRRRALLVFDGVECLSDVDKLQALGDGHTLLLLSRQRLAVPDLVHQRNLSELSQEQAPRLPIHLKQIYDSLTPDARHVFLLLGLLAPAPFPLYLIQDILEISEDVVQQAIDSLVDLSVLRRHDLGYEVSHPDVHTFAAELLSSPIEATSTPSLDTIAIWQERFLTTLLNYFEQGDYYHQVTLTLWLPHVLPLLTAEYLTAHQSLIAARLFNAVGMSTFVQARYEHAELLYQRALAIREQQLHPSHLDLSTSQSNLALLYYKQMRTSKYPEAESLYKRALVIREQKLGPTHYDTLEILNCLALIYNAQEKHAESEVLCKRALAISEDLLGLTYSDITNLLRNLAYIYEAQKKYLEAEQTIKRAIATREQYLEPTHPDIVNSLDQLALFYSKRGKYAQAEPLYERALEILEKQLGGSHPRTATIMNHLAELYLAQGNNEKAEVLLQRALVIREEQLGSAYIETSTSLNNLAILYYRQGRQEKYGEVEALFQRALAIREEQLEPLHPFIVLSLNNLAGFYYTQRRYTEAEPLYKRMHLIAEEKVGPSHRTTVLFLNNLVKLYYAQGRPTEATLYKRAHSIPEEQTGSSKYYHGIVTRVKALLKH